MPTLAPTPDRFTVLDSLIVRALAELRTARRACGRPGDARALELALELRTQAEANLNALLEYRHAAQQR
ncbi:hypothetical protein [Geodermatophilus sp. SYSU D00684]